MLRRLAYRGRALMDLCAAERELLAAQARLLFRPVGRLIDVAPPGAVDPPTTAARWDEVDRVARAIARAAAHGLTRPRCLARAMATQRMLERRGLRGATVRLGVRMEGSRLEAHAWVEYRGVRIDEHPRLSGGFTELATADDPWKRA